MNCFNYISEDDIARKVLYNVCKYNMSTHTVSTEVNGVMTDTEEEDDDKFKSTFESYKRFNDLFE